MSPSVLGPHRLVRRALATTGVLGALALVSVLALAVRRGDTGAVLAAAVATTWLAAGLLGLRSRTPATALLLISAVGSLHLVSFAVSGWLDELRVVGAPGWLGQVFGSLLFGAGFVVLATLLATYPSGEATTRGQRLLVRAGVALLGLHVLQQALASRYAEPAVASAGHVRTPWTPPVEAPSVLMPALLLLVLAGAVLLVHRVRTGDVGDRRRGSWAALAGLLLATMMIGAPAGVALLGATTWALFFLVGAGAVPFLLAAGVDGWRLAAVDRYTVRLFSRGLLFVVVLSVYAAIAAVAARAWPAAVVVTLVAVVLGAPGLSRVEGWGDRWLTGGRLRSARQLDELSAVLATSAPAQLGRRTAEAVRAATGARWTRLAVDGMVVAGSGTSDGAATVQLTLRAAGQPVGVLECGPRPGGWRSEDLVALERVVSHAALAIREARLSAELAARVEELNASRERLVRAEESVRRQVERDLHDGVQQQLVALLARLEVLRHLAAAHPELADVVSVAHDLATEALHDLRALTAGIHPALLSDRGLVVAIRERAAHLPLAVTVDADPRLEGERFAAEVEGAAYFVVAEALTNVVKHAAASRARVVLAPLAGGGLRVAVVDEGTGAASYDGSGLAGLRDRVEALGGSFTLTALPGVGTTVTADLGVAQVVVER